MATLTTRWRGVRVAGRSHPYRRAVASGLSLPDALTLIASNLLRRKGRVAVTALGVIVGTAAVIVLISLGAGLQRQALESLGTGVTELRVMAERGPGALRSAEPPRGGRSRRDPVILDSTRLAQIEALPGVLWVVPFEPVLGMLDVETGRRCTPSVSVIGLDPHRAEALELAVASGTFDLGRGQVVLGARVTQDLIGSGGPREITAAPATLVGQYLHLYGRRSTGAGEVAERRFRMQIVGILAPRGGRYDYSLFISEREAVDFNGWLLAQRRDPVRQGYAEALVKVADVQTAATVERDLLAMGFNFTSDLQLAETVEAYFGELQALLGGIAAISLLVAAFSIANTMLMAVCERTREIGLMKAIGASDRDIMVVFLGEAGSIGLLGGMSGVALGMALNGLINLGSTELAALRQLFGAGTRLRAYTPFWLPCFTVMFAFVVGVVAGLVPARRAVRLHPLTALKSK
jgi:putative ABC transport system permease protein